MIARIIVTVMLLLSLSECLFVFGTVCPGKNIGCSNDVLLCATFPIPTVLNGSGKCRISVLWSQAVRKSSYVKGDNSICIYEPISNKYDELTNAVFQEDITR